MGTWLGDQREGEKTVEEIHLQHVERLFYGWEVRKQLAFVTSRRGMFQPEYESIMHEIPVSLITKAFRL